MKVRVLVLGCQTQSMDTHKLVACVDVFSFSFRGEPAVRFEGVHLFSWVCLSGCFTDS